VPHYQRDQEEEEEEEANAPQYHHDDEYLLFLQLPPPPPHPSYLYRIRSGQPQGPLRPHPGGHHRRKKTFSPSPSSPSSFSSNHIR